MLFTTRRMELANGAPLGRRLLMATSAFALAAGLNLVGGERALAQCAPEGTAAGEEINCNGNDGNGINGQGGDDTINVNAGATVVGNTNGGDANDIINILTGGKAGNVSGDAGDDTIVVAAGAIVTGKIDGKGLNDTLNLAGSVQMVLGGEGNDKFNVTGGTGVSLDGQGGNDIVDFTAAAYTGGITGGLGSDKITVTSGSLGAGVTGDEGADTITIGGFGLGDTPAIMGNIAGGLESDLLNINNGTVGNISGDEGADTINIGFVGSTLMGGLVSAGSEDDLVQMLGGTVMQISGDDGNDLISISDGTVTGVGGVAVAGGSGDDTVSLGDGTFTGDVTGGTGNDLMGIAGLTASLLTGNLLGQEGDDTINVGNGNITGNAEGGSGADSIQILGGSIEGELRGGGAGEGADGSDTITIASADPMGGGEIGGTVSGDDANDTIRLTLGSVGGDIEGDAGDDTIVVEGGTVGVTVEGNEGNDSITMTGGSVGALLSGNTGNDTIRMFGGTVGMSVTGGEDNDFVSVTEGMVGANVEGNDSNDILVVGDFLGGTPTVGGNVEGGAGMDRVSVFDGTVGNITGDAGNDTILVGFIGSTLTAGLVSGGSENDDILVAGGTMTQIAGDAGIDLITISGGTATGVGGVAVTGGIGADTIVMLGGDMKGNVEGDADNDFLSIVGGTIVGSLLGEEGNDSIRVSGTALVKTNVEGGIGTDSIEMLDGTVASDVRGDAGNDTIMVSGGQVGSDVQGGTENDIISIAGGDIDGNVEGNEGNDTISITGTSIGGDVIGGLGNDTILVDSSGSIGGSILGDAGDDTLVLRSIGTISGGVDAGADNDLVRIFGVNAGENFDQSVSGLTTLQGGAGLDQLEFLGAIAELPDSFGGFETILLLPDNLGSTVVDVFNSSNVRVLTADLVYSSFLSTLEASNGPGGLGGDLTITGNFASTGFLDMADGGDTLDEVTVNGNYAGGSISVMFIDAELDATNDADLLTILGGVTDVTVGAPVNSVVPGGFTLIVVDDIGSGIGILTGDGPGAGIPVVDVSNTGNTNDDDFGLADEPLEVGAVEYFLDLESDGIWYLQSVFQDQVFGYSGTQSAVLYMAHDYLGTLQERVGTREQQWTGGATAISDGMGLWLRGGGTFGTVEADDNAGGFGLNEYDYDHFFGQLGIDVPFAVSETGRFVGSVFGQAGSAEVKALDESGNEASTADITAYGGGFSLTYYGGGEDWAGQPGPHAGAGLYADLIAVFNWYDADVSDTAGVDQGHKGTVEGWGWGAGLEVGYGFFLNNGLRLVPQAQISYTAAYLDDFVDDDGIAVDYGTTDSLEGRIGLQVDSGKLWRSGNAYVEANIVQEFLGDNELSVSTLDAGTDIGGTSAELGLGGSFSFADNVGAYVEVDYRIPFDKGRQGVGVIGGIKVNW